MVKTFGRVAACAVFCALLASSLAHAQSDPVRETKIIIAAPAGDSIDLAARLIADKLRRLLRQPVTVENRSDTDDTASAIAVAKAEPDGSTLGLATVTALAIRPHLRAGTPYDPFKDFTPVMLIARNTTILVVRADSPISSTSDLVARAREKPGTIRFGSSGDGEVSHLALELFQSAADVKFQRIPYRDAASALAALLSGDVEALALSAQLVLPHVQNGMLKALGVMSNQRNPMLMDLPTLAEQGFPNTIADDWYALIAPANTPKVPKLSHEVYEAMKEPDVKSKLVRSGTIPSPTSPDDAAAFLKSEFERWGKIVRESGLSKL